MIKQAITDATQFISIILSTLSQPKIYVKETQDIVAGVADDIFGGKCRSEAGRSYVEVLHN